MDDDRLLWTRGVDVAVQGCGAAGLLEVPLTAFVASRQCPGVAIRAAMDWAVVQARSHRAVISGFHSPLEQSVLTLLLQAGSPAVVVLGRPVAGARLPPAWAQPLRQGAMAVVSTATEAARMTEQVAVERNRLAGRLSSQIVVAHASPNGRLAGLVDQWRVEGRQITLLV